MTGDPSHLFPFPLTFVGMNCRLEPPDSKSPAPWPRGRLGLWKFETTWIHDAWTNLICYKICNTILFLWREVMHHGAVGGDALKWIVIVCDQDFEMRFIRKIIMSLLVFSGTLVGSSIIVVNHNTTSTGRSIIIANHITTWTTSTGRSIIVANHNTGFTGSLCSLSDSTIPKHMVIGIWTFSHVLHVFECLNTKFVTLSIRL